MRTVLWITTLFLLVYLCGCSSLDNPVKGGGPNNPEPVSYTQPLLYTR